MKLLIVEDEKKIGEYLTKGLIEVGFVVDLVDNGLNGYYLVMIGDYDLIIFDIMLLDVNGWDIVCMLCFVNKGMLILLFIVFGIIEHCVKGLELGVDDYLMKLFVFVELLVWVCTFLWCGVVVIIESQFQVVDLMVDFVSCKVICSGMCITLISKEFILLEFFFCYQGEVLFCLFIVLQVWDMNFDSDINVIDVVVKWLCGKIDNDFELKLIQIVCGVGYMFEVLDGQ